MNSLNSEKRSQPSHLSHFLLNFSIAHTHTHVYTHSRSLALLHAHTPFFSFFPYPQTRSFSLSLSLSHTQTHTRFISLNCSSDDLWRGESVRWRGLYCKKNSNVAKDPWKKREEKWNGTGFFGDKKNSDFFRIRKRIKKPSSCSNVAIIRIKCLTDTVESIHS